MPTSTDPFTDMLLDKLFNKPAVDSCCVSHKYLAPALQPRKPYIWGRRRIVCSLVPRLCERNAPATNVCQVRRSLYSYRYNLNAHAEAKHDGMPKITRKRQGALLGPAGLAWLSACRPHNYQAFANSLRLSQSARRIARATIISVGLP